MFQRSSFSIWVLYHCYFNISITQMNTIDFELFLFLDEQFLVFVDFLEHFEYERVDLLSNRDQ